MPFKSEAQRKYLWANEPEIARDWTDTYGSRIQKDDGGISHLVKPGLGRPGYNGQGDKGTYGQTGQSYGDRKISDTSPEVGDIVSTPKPEPDRGFTNYAKQEIKKVPGFMANKYLGKTLGIGYLPAAFIGSMIKDKIQNRNTGDDQASYDFSGIEGDVAGNYSQNAVANQMLGMDFDSLNSFQQGQINDAINTYGTTSQGFIKSAEGGRIGYQMGNMVGAEMEGAEMEGAEMEGAMMQSKEVIKELYDAFIAQGLSPQEAIEKIKEIIGAAQAQEPQSPMMGEEFPGQEFGRAPAAFGGIMDTYTGRRKYGIGSFVKKLFKKVKKLASSKVGKLALMYTAGTYLGGMQAFGGPQGGMGWKKFGTRLLNPMSTEGGISNIGRTAMNLVRGSPQPTNVANQAWRTSNVMNPENLKKTKDAGTFLGIPTKVAAGIAGPAIGAGAYTAAKPPETLGGEVTDEWETGKSDFDKYLASLNADYSVNPSLLKSAQGGRVGRQEGGLMNLGGMEKDYRNDGGFVPLGGEEKADDVPARLSRNEFVFTADAVRNAGGGDIDKGAEVMENVMKNLEGGGQISEESQGQGAQEMFETSERLSEVI